MGVLQKSPGTVHVRARPLSPNPQSEHSSAPLPDLYGLLVYQKVAHVTSSGAGWQIKICYGIKHFNDVMTFKLGKFSLNIELFFFFIFIHQS